MEQRLRYSQQMLMEAQWVARLGTYVYEVATCQWESSEVLDQIFGIAPDARKDRDSWLALIHPDDRQMMLAHLTEVLTRSVPFDKQYRIVRANDGETRWVRGLGSLDLDGAGNPLRMVGTIQDITESKLLEEELKLKSFTIDNITEAVYWLSQDGRIWAVNEAACRSLGYSEQELLSMSILDIAPDHSTADLSRTWQLIKQHGSLRFESIHCGKDGRRVPVEVTANYCRYGDIEYNCAIVHDITSRKEAEAEKQELMLQLSQSQKMESVGRLAGGIAHDFNNLLTPILGYAELLRLDLAEDSCLELDAITQAAERARVLTQQLLSFGRKQLLEMKVLDLNKVVASFYDILRRTIRENIEIRLQLTPDELGIRADQNQLLQIIMNLVVNAQDAIEDKGTITIATAPVTLDEEAVRLHAGVEPGRYQMLTVIDTGKGMDQDTLSHIFEPFFTTKGVGAGTGLGLAMVYGLTKQHGGHIWVDSQPGRGTAFKLYFPVVSEAPHAVVAQQPASQPNLEARERIILLVEDNEMVRRLVRDLLVSYGFEVLVEQGPRQALALCQGRHLDLLVTDVVMPEMHGPELYQGLLKSHPGLKVLYMSGYTNNIIAQHSVLDEGTNFIQKPFTSAELARKINAVLNCPA